jgi:ABC-type lipoprotein release transport system permease subunit
MLINENLNLKYGVQTGDAVALIGADGLRRSVTRLSPPRMQRFDVTGIYEMRQILEGDRVYIDLLSAQQVFRMPREVSGYELELRRPDDAERVREELLEWIFGDAGAEGRVPGDVFAGGGAVEGGAVEGVVVERGALVGSAAGGGAVEGVVVECGALVGSAVGRGAVGRGVDPGAVGVAGLRAQDLNISTWYDLQKPLYDVMELEKWGSFIILMIIIFVAVLNIVGSMTMMVIQKKRDIGLLLAMGLTPAGIGKIFRMQGFQVGLIGCLLGGGIGLFLAKMQQMYGWVKLSSAFIIDAYPVVIEPSDVLLVFAGTMVLSVLASGYPAWRGGRTDPSVALRND